MSLTKFLAEYDQLPTEIKEQLKTFSLTFEGRRDVIEHAKAILTKFKVDANKKDNYRIAIRLAILDQIPTRSFFKSKLLTKLVAFDLRGHKINIKKVLIRGRRVCLLEANLIGKATQDGVTVFDEPSSSSDKNKHGNDLGEFFEGDAVRDTKEHKTKDVSKSNKPRPVIIKWYQSIKRDSSYEIKVYKTLRRAGCTVPWFSSKFFLWSSPILVMEPLNSVTADDNEFLLTVHVLAQLEILHKFAIHNDIKPGNVMWRWKADKTKEYLVIDYGGVATEKLEHGYRRWIWSPKWTSQKARSKEPQVTTAKNDFIELGYTMKTIQNYRTGAKEIRTKFEGPLLEFMERVKKVNPKAITSKDYSDLTKIAKNAISSVVFNPKGKVVKDGDIIKAN
jgi:hypothetical protein